ncbi:MAG: hypothetical protein PVJ52_00725 [Candidatus Woesebacteria bacterium]|jgi:hypothetical protein
MTIQHKKLAQGGWSKLSLVEQLANVGSEVERAIKWKEKGNDDYSRMAYHRALELLSFTKDDCKDEAKLKEVCRLYEVLVDYFDGYNEYGSSDKLWRKYFDYFSKLAARRRSL